MKQPTPLQKIHLEAIEKIDKLIDSLPFNEKKTAKQAKRANVQILYKLGWRLERTKNKQPCTNKKKPVQEGCFDCWRKEKHCFKED
jgi:hypothetical protein